MEQQMKQALSISLTLTVLATVGCMAEPETEQASIGLQTQELTQSGDGYVVARGIAINPRHADLLDALASGGGSAAQDDEPGGTAGASGQPDCELDLDACWNACVTACGSLGCKFVSVDYKLCTCMPTCESGGDDEPGLTEPPQKETF